jgi:hypothetical protein
MWRYYITDKIAIKKSSIFEVFLRYEYSPFINIPKAMILKKISMENIIVVIIST